MDAEAAVLLTTAGSTVVSLMATDAWQQTHDGLLRLWHRFRPEHADAIGQELAAGEPGDLWMRELPALLAYPQAARELANLLAACVEAAGGPVALSVADSGAAPKKVQVEAKAKGHARAYASGRDMTFNERP
jgi:hypothetical protein